MTYRSILDAFNTTKELTSKYTLVQGSAWRLDSQDLHYVESCELKSFTKDNRTWSSVCLILTDGKKRHSVYITPDRTFKCMDEGDLDVMDLGFYKVRSLETGKVYDQVKYIRE